MHHAVIRLRDNHVLNFHLLLAGLPFHHAFEICEVVEFLILALLKHLSRDRCQRIVSLPRTASLRLGRWGIGSGDDRSSSHKLRIHHNELILVFSLASKNLPRADHASVASEHWLQG